MAIAIGILIWALSGVFAYLVVDVAARHSGRQTWDTTMREFTLISSILLGPILLLIAAELLLFEIIGDGLADDRTRRYKDS